MKRLIYASVWCMALAHAQPQRVLFINNAPESVLATIDDEGITPRGEHTVLSGQKRYYFPLEPLEDRPLFIRLSGSLFRQELTLALEGAPARNGMLSHTCRSFGDLVLKRLDSEVARVPAPGSDKAIILEYTNDFDLVFGENMATHSTRQFSCRPRCSSRSLCRKRSCQRIKGSSHYNHFKKCARQTCRKRPVNTEKNPTSP